VFETEQSTDDFLGRLTTEKDGLYGLGGLDGVSWAMI
jgi:hypothetical protein